MADSNDPWPAGVFNPNTADDDPSDLAALAHITPEQATQLPDAVLQALAYGRSYSEGQKIPVQRDFGEPTYDPAGAKELQAFTGMIEYNTTLNNARNQTYNDSTMTYTAYPEADEFARGGPVRRKRHPMPVGPLTLAAIQMVCRRELARRGLLRGALSSARR